MVEHVEVLVEEPSMEVALRILLPRLLERVSFEIYPYQCKTDLLTKLPDRLKGYGRWLPTGWRIVVVVDCDNDDCLVLKQQMEQSAADAGLTTRSMAGSAAYSVVNRIVIEELEAWYFGDWEAVRSAYPRVPGNIPQKAPYHNPDSIRGGTWESFERIMQKAGYFRNGLRKIEAARAVAEYWQASRNRSHSFKVFCHAVQEIEASLT